MKTFNPKTPKAIAIGLASASLLVGGVAIAQQGPGDRAPMTRDQMVQKTTERFAKMDVNGDGQISTADREARMAQRFAEADANGDGALTQEEMASAREARRAERTEQREARAAAGGGEERMGRRGGGKHHGKRGGRGGFGKAMMERADTDGNGAISQAEFQAAVLARFDQADANGDGTVTSDEHRAAREAMRAQRQGS
ncbi:EF-hand domain-containing protein [Altererythrobacter sp. MTPC7]|uniref:EF-hand domain-containing protein n=1 Tax=Altererythrobacter sp. MTPC7 TaxID=3056567 RepID=UPI0036F444A2